MAVIGMLGGILFQVSDRQVLNFSKLQRASGNGPSMTYWGEGGARISGAGAPGSDIKCNSECGSA